jgi:GT2 family glycosyltransferase
MEYPLVSIVTVNYDHPEVTLALLASLRLITYPNIEIVVVDNASPKDDPAILKKSYPEIIFIQSSENLGFAGGNNLGIRKTQGNICFLSIMILKLNLDFLSHWLQNVNLIQRSEQLVPKSSIMIIPIRSSFVARHQ